MTTTNEPIYKSIRHLHDFNPDDPIGELPIWDPIDQKDRPDYYEGIIEFEGEKYRFSTGCGEGLVEPATEQYPEPFYWTSIPSGHYGPIMPPFGPLFVRYKGAILATRITEPKYNQSVRAIGIHGTVLNGPKWTNVCIQLQRHDWLEFQPRLYKALIDEKQKLYLNVDHRYPNDTIIFNK